MPQDRFGGEVVPAAADAAPVDRFGGSVVSDGEPEAPVGTDRFGGAVVDSGIPAPGSRLGAADNLRQVVNARGVPTEAKLPALLHYGYELGLDLLTPDTQEAGDRSEFEAGLDALDFGLASSIAVRGYKLGKGLKKVASLLTARPVFSMMSQAADVAEFEEMTGEERQGFIGTLTEDDPRRGAYEGMASALGRVDAAWAKVEAAGDGPGGAAAIRAYLWEQAIMAPSQAALFKAYYLPNKADPFGGTGLPRPGVDDGQADDALDIALRALIHGTDDEANRATRKVIQRGGAHLQEALISLGMGVADAYHFAFSDEVAKEQRRARSRGSLGERIEEDLAMIEAGDQRTGTLLANIALTVSPELAVDRVLRSTFRASAPVRTMSGILTESGDKTLTGSRESVLEGLGATVEIEAEQLGRLQDQIAAVTAKIGNKTDIDGRRVGGIDYEELIEKVGPGEFIVDASEEAMERAIKLADDGEVDVFYRQGRVGKYVDTKIRALPDGVRLAGAERFRGLAGKGVPLGVKDGDHWRAVRLEDVIGRHTWETFRRIRARRGADVTTLNADALEAAWALTRGTAGAQDRRAVADLLEALGQRDIGKADQAFTLLRELEALARRATKATGEAAPSRGGGIGGEVADYVPTPGKPAVAQGHPAATSTADEFVEKGGKLYEKKWGKEVHLVDGRYFSQYGDDWHEFSKDLVVVDDVLSIRAGDGEYVPLLVAPTLDGVVGKLRQRDAAMAPAGEALDGLTDYLRRALKAGQEWRERSLPDSIKEVLVRRGLTAEDGMTTDLGEAAIEWMRRDEVARMRGVATGEGGALGEAQGKLRRLRSEHDAAHPTVAFDSSVTWDATPLEGHTLLKVSSAAVQPGRGLFSGKLADRLGDSKEVVSLGSGGLQPGKMRAARKFMGGGAAKRGVAVRPARVGVADGKVVFDDGRHRVWAAGDLDQRFVLVAVRDADVGDFKRLVGGAEPANLGKPLGYPKAVGYQADEVTRLQGNAAGAARALDGLSEPMRRAMKAETPSPTSGTGKALIRRGLMEEDGALTDLGEAVVEQMRRADGTAVESLPVRTTAGVGIDRRSADLDDLAPEGPFVPGLEVGGRLDDLSASLQQQQALLRELTGAASAEEARALQALADEIGEAARRTADARSDKAFNEAIAGLSGRELQTAQEAIVRAGGRKIAVKLQPVVLKVGKYFDGVFEELKASGLLRADMDKVAFLKSKQVQGYVTHLLSESRRSARSALAKNRLTAKLPAALHRSGEGSIVLQNELKRRDWAELYLKTDAPDLTPSSEQIDATIRELGLDKMEFFETDMRRILLEYGEQTSRSIADARFMRTITDLFPEGEQFVNMAKKSTVEQADRLAAEARFKRVGSATHIRTLLPEGSWVGWDRYASALDLITSQYPPGQGQRFNEIMKFLKRPKEQGGAGLREVDDNVIQQAKLIDARDVYLPESLANAIDDMTSPEAVRHDSDLAKVIKGWRNVTSLLKSALTVGHLAFHGRNFISNTVQLHLVHGTDAITAQADSLRLLHLPPESVLTLGGRKKTVREWKQEARRLGVIADHSPSDIRQGLSRGRLSLRRLAMITAGGAGGGAALGALQGEGADDILQGALVGATVAAGGWSGLEFNFGNGFSTMREALSRGKKPREAFAAGFDEFVEDYFTSIRGRPITGTLALPAEGIFVAGGAAGQAIENQARVASYVAGLKRGMSEQASADLVNRTLFDYGDLQPFEQRVMKMIFPFYVWNKKNALELQPYLMQHRPTEYAIFTRFLDAASREARPTDEEMAFMDPHLRYRLIMSLGPGKILSSGILPQEAIMEWAKWTELPGGTPLPSGFMANLNPIMKVSAEYLFGQHLFYGAPIKEIRSARDVRDFGRPWAEVEQSIRETGEPNRHPLQEFVGYREFVDARGRTKFQTGWFWDAELGWTEQAERGARRMWALKSTPYWRFTQEYRKIVADTFVTGTMETTGGQKAGVLERLGQVGIGLKTTELREKQEARDLFMYLTMKSVLQQIEDQTSLITRDVRVPKSRMAPYAQ